MPDRPLKRTPKSRKALSDDSLKATILSHAATFGVTATAKEFGVDRKTIQRYRAELESGKNPQLSQLVARETELSKERSRSKIQRALDAMLDRVIALAPNAKLTEAILGVEKIGDLATARRVLGVEGDSEGQTAPGHEGVGGPAESASGDQQTAVH